jgi:hypothetical protein
MNVEKKNLKFYQCEKSEPKFLNTDFLLKESPFFEIPPHANYVLTI